MRKTFPFYLSLFLLLLVSCQRESSEEPPQEIIPHYGGIYRSPLDFEPKTLDPAISTDMYADTIIQQVFDGLVQFDKELNIIPSIAKSWKVSQDGLVYTFFLKKGVKFHNGREVTAEDFVYAYARTINPKTKASAREFYEKILGAKDFQDGKTKKMEGLTVIDKYTLKIILSEPYAPFLSLLAMNMSKLFPREEVERSDRDFGKYPLGTGAFRFVSWEPGKEITLEANKDYFDGRPFLDTIKYRVFAGANYDDMFDKFSAGDLEKTNVPVSRREDLFKSQRYQVMRRPSLSLLYYGFNTKIKPLDNKTIRQAINLAIDKDRIVEVAMRGKDVKATSILPPGMPGYRPHKDAYPFNPKKAKTLLKEAGYPDGKGLPIIEVWSASTAEATIKELEIIKSNLSEVGIKVDIRYENDWPTYAGYLDERKLQIFRYVWYADFPDPDNFLSILFHSKTKYNFASYGNPEADRLMDEAKKEIDMLKRADLYRRAEEIVLGDAPLVPILHRTYEEIYQPYVKGIEVSALGAPYIPMKKVWLDEKTSVRND